MTDILVAFVIPIVVIIVAAILQTLLRCPFKVAGIVFVVLIIAAFALGATTMLLLLAWLYTVLAFIVAWAICRCFRVSISCRCGDDDSNGNNNRRSCGNCNINNIDSNNGDNINNITRNNVTNNTFSRYWMN